jgi:hypothetical protein
VLLHRVVDGYSTIPTITSHNAKSPLLRLPAELRVRIFEYVFGQARYHVQATDQDGGHIPVFLFRCRFAVCHVGHSQRKSPVKDDVTGPTTTDDNDLFPPFKDDTGIRNHRDCYFEYQGPFIHWRNTGARERMRRYERGPLPTTLLLTCKQIHHDAASIFWRNNTFLMKFSKDDHQTFVGHMTIAQRKAVRSIALSFIEGSSDRHSWQRPPTSYEDLLILRAAERASFLALTDLRRLELFIGMQAGLTASNIHRALDPTDYDLMFEMDRIDHLHMWICWIRLLQRPDMDRIDVRVEADTESDSASTWSFGTSIQQRADWEPQVELIIRGRLGELDGKLSFPRSLNSDTASVDHRWP